MSFSDIHGKNTLLRNEEEEQDWKRSLGIEKCTNFCSPSKLSNTSTSLHAFVLKGNFFKESKIAFICGDIAILSMTQFESLKTNSSVVGMFWSVITCLFAKTNQTVISLAVMLNTV